MKNMSKAQENWQAPPPGRYLSRIVSAEATSSKKSGASMLHLTVAILDERYEGIEADDYIITDGSAKGAGLGKKKMRALGTPLILRAIDTDEDIPDAAIAQELLGTQLFVDFGNEQKMGRRDASDPSSPFDSPLTTTDVNGKVVPLNKLTVVGYSRSAMPQAQAAAPQQFAPPAQFVPQQQVPQQFVPQAQAPQGFVQSGFVPQAQPQQFAPQGFPGAGQMQMAYPNQGQVQAQPVWNNGGAVQQVQAEEPKKRRKVVEG